MDFLRQLFGIDPTRDDLHGTWKSTFNFPTIQGEDLTLYSNKGKFASVLKLARLPSLPYISKLYLYAGGSFYIKEGKLNHTYDEVKVLYNYGVPQEYEEILMNNIINSGSSEIISFNKNELVTKSVKSGITISARRISTNINPDDLDKFIEEGD